jgi:septation ring formation regulator EzrA
MTETHIAKSLDDLNKLVLDGRTMDAFEKYYHDHVEMQENNSIPTKGKNENRLRELDFLNNVTEFRRASVEGMAVNESTSFVVWNYDYTHRLWGERKYTQVAVQNWKDGKIIREQFFYGS